MELLVASPLLENTLLYRDSLIFLLFFFRAKEHRQYLLQLLVNYAFFIIVLISCWDTVEPTYYGLKCSSISKTCNKDEVFESGRHLVGPT